MTTEALHDLPGITSQIYDSDNSRPFGSDRPKAPQSHHLKNASHVINIPHSEMFMAVTVINSNKFPEPINDTSPRDSLEQSPISLPNPG